MGYNLGVSNVCLTCMGDPLYENENQDTQSILGISLCVGKLGLANRKQKRNCERGSDNDEQEAHI